MGIKDDIHQYHILIESRNLRSEEIIEAFENYIRDIFHDGSNADKVTLFRRILATQNDLMLEKLADLLTSERNAADCYIDGKTPFVYACINGNSQIVIKLLKNDTLRMNAQDAQLITPLEHAIKSRRYDIALDLLNNKIVKPDSNSVNKAFKCFIKYINEEIDNDSRLFEAFRLNSHLKPTTIQKIQLKYSGFISWREMISGLSKKRPTLEEEIKNGDFTREKNGGLIDENGLKIGEGMEKRKLPSEIINLARRSLGTAKVHPLNYPNHYDRDV